MTPQRTEKQPRWVCFSVTVTTANGVQGVAGELGKKERKEGCLGPSAIERPKNTSNVIYHNSHSTSFATTRIAVGRLPRGWGHRDGSSHQEDLGREFNEGGLVVELGFNFYRNEGSWNRVSKSNTTCFTILHGFWRESYTY